MPLKRIDETLDLASVTIDTPRLTLRALSAGDTREIFEHFTPSITRYMVPRAPDGIGDTEAFVSLALDTLYRGVDLHLTILLGTDHSFLGLCSLQGRADPELGIWLKASAHGYGYGREAITGLVAWARDQIEFTHLIYPVDRRNGPSRKIPESLGGRIVGERREMSQSGFALDELVYAIPRKPAA